MRKIAYTHPDGRLMIVTPAPRSDLEKVMQFESEEQYEQFVWGRVIPEGAIHPHFIEDEEIPSDRTFRNAWVLEDGVITHDIDKAIDIKKDQLRALRKPKLEALDIEAMKALESEDSEKFNEIKVKKQKLRDITDLEFPRDIDELKEFIPEDLE